MPTLIISAVDVDVSGVLTLGDLIVGLGTALLAFFTWRLAVATYTLDARNEERERLRREREQRGFARLVVVELSIVVSQLDKALEKGYWLIGWALPTDAWEQHAALIVQALPVSVAADLTGVEGGVAAFRSSWIEIRSRIPNALYKIPLDVDPSLPTEVEELRDATKAVIESIREHLPLSDPAPPAPTPGRLSQVLSRLRTRFAVAGGLRVVRRGPEGGPEGA